MIILLDLSNVKARCHVCNRLCCCMKHLLEHESQHLTQDPKNAVAPAKRNRPTELGGWVDTTGSNLHTYTNKISYPLFCVYCKISIVADHNLRYLMRSGPQCLSNASHWLVSRKKYFEITGFSELVPVIRKKYLKTRQFVEDLEKLPETNYTNNKSTPHSYWQFFPRNIHKMESSGLDISPTSEDGVSVFPQVAQKDTFPFVERMCPISTSTPQDECVQGVADKNGSMPSTALTPISKQDDNVPQSILSTVKNNNQPKENSVRKVTFSMDLESHDVSRNGEENVLIEDAEQSLISNDIANMIKKTSVNNCNSSGEEHNLKNDEHCEGILISEQSDDLSENAEKKYTNMDDQFRHSDKIEIMNPSENRKQKSQNQSSEFDEKCDDKLQRADVIGTMKYETKPESSTNDSEGQLKLNGDQKLQNNNEDPRREDALYSGRENVNLVDSMLKVEGFENKKGNCSREDKSFEEDSFELEFYSVDNVEEQSSQLRDSYVNTIPSCRNDLNVSQVSSTDKSPCSTPTQIDDSETEFISSEISTEKSELSNQENLPQVSGIVENSKNKPMVSKLLFAESDGPCSSSQINERSKVQGTSLQTFGCQKQMLVLDNSTRSKRPHNDDDDDDNDEEWSFTRITSALSSSWKKAKCLVMSSLTRKRTNSDNSEADVKASLAKRVKVCPSNGPNTCTVPVQRKFNRKPVRTTDYIRSRRPLPRMEKQ